MEERVPPGPVSVNCASLPARRKASAAGLATKLKGKALVDARPPLTRRSYSERQAIFDSDSHTDLESFRPTSFSTPLPRKCRMSSGSDGGEASKRGRGQNDDSLLREIIALIQRSEERTVGRTDEKIDGLSCEILKLGSEM